MATITTSWTAPSSWTGISGHRIHAGIVSGVWTEYPTNVPAPGTSGSITVSSVGWWYVSVAQYDADGYEGEYSTPVLLYTGGAYVGPPVGTPVLSLRGWMAILLVLLLTGTGWAACTGSSPSWTCTSWADLKTLAEGSSTQANDTITLAAGTHAFTALITPAKRLTITGIESSACPFTSCDTKVTASSSSMWALGSTGSRVSNIQYTFSTCSGNIITVRHNNWRVDHNRFLCPLAGTKVDAVSYSNSACYYPSCILGGLVDNNYVQNAAFYVAGSAGGLTVNALAHHAIPFKYGDEQAVYFEDNTIIISRFGHIFDVSYGGSYVARFNALYKTGYGTSTGSILEGHGLRYAYSFRGPMRFEAYKNTGNIEEGDVGFYRGGTGVLWGNRITTTLGGLNNIGMDHRRSPGGDGSPTCDGTQGDYDSNEGLPAGPGWLCRDQIGSGYDLTAYDGSLPLPAQIKMPAYTWDNGLTTVAVSADAANEIKENRDWFNASSSTGTPQTTGVRSGAKASMPAGCTTGVGFWVTDEGYWNSKTPGVAAGVLYKCTATNTWTPYYTPYPYPHPLQSGLSAPTGVR